MAIQIQRPLIPLILGTVFACLVVALLGPAFAAPAPFPRPDNLYTRTYRFKARITDNGGITPFKRGRHITGAFTYDLKSKAVRTDSQSYGWS
jgi:hypothetical protein